nr:p40 [Darna trima granulovirus]
MSSAKTRLFLVIEKLKNAMDDAQMAYPFWEKFFPLFGSSNTVSLEIPLLGEMINEAAEAAEQLVITQGGALYSQHVQNAATTPATAAANPLLAPLRSVAALTNVTPAVFDAKRYHPAVVKFATYMLSASQSSTAYTVSDIVKLYLYIAQTGKYKPLYVLLEQALFRKEKECVPVVSPETTTLVLDNIRDLTTTTSYRLDYESMILMLTNIQRSLYQELSKFPQVKVKDIISNINVYEKEVKPYKALADKFELLVAQKVSHYVMAADNELTFKSNPLFIENMASVIEKNCDMNRMVYNSINNIFINAVEQSAAENIKFDIADYNKRFRIMDRVRENMRNNFVDKVAVGDVGTRNRAKTANTSPIQPPIALKKSRLSVEPSK